MAKPTPITFHVPASAANLGPGYGVIAVALDLPLGITVEHRTDGELIIERRDDPHAHMEDPRHDPVHSPRRRGGAGDVRAHREAVRAKGAVRRGVLRRTKARSARRRR